MGPEDYGGEEQGTKKTQTDNNKDYEANEYKPFLEESTIRAIKQCIKPDKTEAKIDKILDIVRGKNDPKNQSRKSLLSRRWNKTKLDEIEPLTQVISLN